MVLVLILKNSAGDHVIIPKKHRAEVQGMIKDGCHGCIDALVNTLPVMADYAEDGTIVSELYKQKTGKDWNTAKAEGLTSGSYEDNMKLRQRLLSGEFESSPKKDFTKAENFNEAFKLARQYLGANQIFEYQGRKYGTNLKGEKFEPSDEVLTKNNMNNLEVKERINNQNRMTTSVYSDKQTTKLEPCIS